MFDHAVVNGIESKFQPTRFLEPTEAAVQSVSTLLSGH